MTPKQRKQHYQITLGRSISQEDYNYVNTTSLQVRSVVEFMSELGYLYFPLFKNTFFAKDGLGFKGAKHLSWATCVNLHDANWFRGSSEHLLVPEFSFVNKLGGGYYEKTFQTDAYTLNKALAAKIVERVFIHCTKHGVLKTYKHQVQMVDQAYQQQFLKPIIDKETKIWQTVGDNIHTLYEN